MKKIILYLFTSFLFIGAQAQTHSWANMKALNDDIPTRYRSQMVSYNNKIYFFGGYGGGNLNDFWEYDPSTKILTELPDLPGFLGNVDGGSAFVVGSKIYLLKNRSEVYEYDFITKIWSSKTNFPGDFNFNKPEAFVVGTLIYAANNTNNRFYSYDPTTNLWTQKEDYPGSIRQGGFAFSLNGKGYKGGGSYNSTYPLQFYEYDPVLDSWAAKANMPVSLLLATALECNGLGYVGTGELSSTTYSTTSWYQYDPNANSWSLKSLVPFPVKYSSSAVIGNEIFVFSGLEKGANKADNSKSFISRYNTLLNTWTTDTLYAGGNRAFSNSFYNNGKIYVVGGRDGEERTDTWQYDISLNKWERKADKPGIGFSEAAQTSVDDKLYLIGGYNRSSTGSALVYINTFLQYDITSDQWAYKALYPGGALKNIGAFTINNTIYAGGGIGTLQRNTFYKYDETADTWSSLANCPEAGQVIASFEINNIGYFVFNTGNMYAYDPIQNLWTQKQSVVDFGSYSTAGTNNSFVKNGNAYLVGFDYETGGIYTNHTLKMYNPIENKWSKIIESPFNKNGKVVVTDGNDVYVGFGIDRSLIGNSSTSYYQVENNWYKLTFEADVSDYIGDKVYNCYGSSGLESKTFTDENGKLFLSFKAAISSTVNTCIQQRSLSTANPFREKLIKIFGNSNDTYSAMFANKNFRITGNNISSGNTLRMYFKTTELNALINAFNLKYGTSKTMSDIKIGVFQGVDLDPENNEIITSSYTIHSPSSYDYKTDDKYLEYTLQSGESLPTNAEVYAVIYENTTTLPVDLVYFDATVKSLGAILNWSTSSETNNAHFILEKSIDGVNFIEIAKIEGQNSVLNSTYEYLDKSFKEDCYYKLIQVDKDGKRIEFNSQIKFLKNIFTNQDIKIYPNPANSFIVVSGYDLSSYQIKILTLEGKLIEIIKISDSSTKLNLSKLAIGKYLIIVESKSGISVQKILKI
ncbi:kelch repeat-containing protein [Pedobacter alpinus]|uniref:Kelch repeat-containing protein n=1 Tax=Pedobacter alpinus TaxID=1590643 RepID=A0ABW5TRP2_9SPHI